MTKRLLPLILLVCGLMILGVAAYAQDETKPADTVAQAPVVVELAPAERYIVTYFHGGRRCATCMKLEAYSNEAIMAEFETGLADSSVIWRTVDYDEDENKHFIDDYALYTKALIISKVNSEGDLAWRNLDRIWKLVGDKEAFITYVRETARKFVTGNSDSE